MIEAETISEFQVQLKGQTILVVRPDHTAYSISIRDITEVYIESHDDISRANNWGHKLWFVLVDEINNNGVTFPLGAVGEGNVVAALHKLKGFVIPDLTSKEVTKHLCWSKFSKK